LRPPSPGGPTVVGRTTFLIAAFENANPGARDRNIRQSDRGNLLNRRNKISPAGKRWRRTKAALAVGRIMGKLFLEGEEVGVDSFSVRRITREEKNENYEMRPIHRYVFTEVSQQ
jgi:hypothetical protein